MSRDRSGRRDRRGPGPARQGGRRGDRLFYLRVNIQIY